MKSYPKKCWPRQTLSCVRSFDLLALLGGPALLGAEYIGKSQPELKFLHVISPLSAFI